MLWINTSQRANSQNSQLSLDDLGKDLLQFGLILLDFDAKFVAISKKAYPNCNEYVRGPSIWSGSEKLRRRAAARRPFRVQGGVISRL